VVVTLKYIIGILIGFGGGVIIAGGIFAFIAVIGVIPRLAQKTNTFKYISLYEEAIILGGVLGSLSSIFKIYIPIGNIGVLIVGVSTGIFYGCLVMSLAEILNVIPVLKRRINVQKGIRVIILSIALGKLCGSVIYFFVPGFSKFY
jgi:stage V sporulation protein AB